MLTLFRKQIGHIMLPADSTTFDTVLDEWLEQTRPRVKRSTFSTYRGVAARYIRPQLGALYTVEMTNADVGMFLENAAEAYSPATRGPHSGPGRAAEARELAGPL